MFWVGCGGGSSSSSSQQGSQSSTVVLKSISLSAATGKLNIGDTRQFTATGTYSDGSSKDVTSTVTWTSSNQGVAQVSAAGLVTAMGGGSTTILATQSSVSGASSISVNASLTGVAVTPGTSTLGTAKTVQLTATGTYSDNSTQNVTTSATWTSSNAAVAQVSATGLVTAVSTGTVTITGTLNGISGTSTITVNVSLTGIGVTPLTSTLAAGNTLQLAATGTYSDTTTGDVTSQATWTSSDTTIATVSSSGLVTAVAAGSVQITGSLNGFSAAATVQVPVSLVSINILPSTPAIELNTTQPMTASGTYSDGTQQDLTNLVTWASSSSSIATIDQTGLVTAVASGSTNITAAMSGITGTTALTVNTPQLVSIVLDQDGTTVPLGLPLQLSATGVFSDNSTAELVGVTYTSSDPTIVSVDANGLATTKLVGSVTITATVGSVSGTGALTVGTQTLVSIAVTPTNPSVPLGLPQQFTVTGTFTDSSTQQLTNGVTWSSSDLTVGTVDVNGLVTTVGLGSATITANINSLSSSGTLTVTAAKLVSIAVTPASVSIPVGVTQQFTATGTYDDTSTQDLTAYATWTSSKGTLATVSNAGLASSVAVGNVTITATSGGVSGTAALTVDTATITGLTITPANPSVKKGTRVQFTATAQYSDGTSFDVSRQVSWHSSKPSITHINGAGLARAHKTGTATITAQFGSTKATTTMTVTN